MNSEETTESMTEYHHDIIKEFLENTENTDKGITPLMKATIAQFLINTRTKVYEIALNSDTITREQFIGIQIQELSRCIMDLRMILINKGTLQ